MAIQRPDTPLANTPDPIYDRVQSVMTSKENNGKRSVIHKETSSVTNSDGSGMSSFNKQKEKENGKIKLKSYNVATDKEGNPTRLEINRDTNTGNSRRRVITNPKKIERKLGRVLKRNEM